jgi:hypothetical protein
LPYNRGKSTETPQYVDCIGERRRAYRVWFGNLKEGHHLKDKGVEGKTYSNSSSRNRMGGLDWITLAQNGDRWRALVNAVMKLWVTYNARNFLIT